MIRKIKNYFEAVRYLSFKQIFFRIYFRFFKLPIISSQYRELTLPERPSHIHVYSSNSVLLGPSEIEYRFLGTSKVFDRRTIPWSDKSLPKLWNYQLHYFDYIHALSKEEALFLIRDWIEKNKNKNEWEPYPTSLRIINWLIFLTNHAIRDQKIGHSIWIQHEELLKRLEYHLLGNHLWENYRALIFVALAYKNTSLLTEFENKLFHEMQDQILPDGAHAELAPMYQSIMLNGLIDLSEFYKLFGVRPKFPLADYINKMSNYLAFVCHPDGKVAQLNDSAIDFSLPPKAIKNIPVSSQLMKDSGHARLQTENITLIADVGPVAYSYLAGHSHSDNLTFELSFKGSRVIVDPGISTYEICEQRSLERQTAFHNTLKVKGLEQSDTWMSFRLGRRATSYSAIFEQSSSVTTLTGKYSYQDKGISVEHERTWELEPSHLRIKDLILSSKNAEAYLSLNFRPGLNVLTKNANEVEISDGSLVIAKIKTDAQKIEISDSFYSPNFGQKFDCQRLQLHFKTLEQKNINTDIYFV